MVRQTGRVKSIAVTAFKARCLSLLEDVARTGEPLIVTKRGKPLARIVASGLGGVHPQSTLAGTVTVVGDIMAPVLPPSAWNAVGGVLLSPKRRTRRR